MRLHRIVPLALAFLANACGSDKAPTDPTTGGAAVTNGTFTATINGTNWSAIGQVAVTRANNIVSIAGASTTYVISFGIGTAGVAGVYPLSYQNPTGSIAIASNVSGGGWATSKAGGAGTITLTALTATRVAGTFVFDAPAVSGNATGTLHVTNGKFDVTY